MDQMSHQVGLVKMLYFFTPLTRVLTLARCAGANICCPGRRLRCIRLRDQPLNVGGMVWRCTGYTPGGLGEA